MLHTRGCCASHGHRAVPAFTYGLSRLFVTHLQLAGHSRPLFTGRASVAVLSDTEMLIHPIHPRSSTVPRCVWLRHAPSTELYARPTVSASARSRNSVPSTEPAQSTRESKKLPPQPANGNYGGPKVRDRLCELIRRHQLDSSLVKAYATDFCGVKTLREATREQVENFVKHLADWAEKDRNALLCQLNSYLGQKAGAA
jgi:hypothetical protein